jgi:hypothetical protein
MPSSCAETLKALDFALGYANAQGELFERCSRGCAWDEASFSHGPSFEAQVPTPRTPTSDVLQRSLVALRGGAGTSFCGSR